MLHEMGLLVFLAVTSTAQQNLEAQIGSNYCDGSLWRRVYKPQRLQKLQRSCITVTGTIGKSETEKDGNFYVQLKLDAKAVFKKMLKDRNRKAQNGNLIWRPVGGPQVTRTEAGGASQ